MTTREPRGNEKNGVQYFFVTEEEFSKLVDNNNAGGIAAEVGAIGRLGNFALSLGCQTVNFKYLEMSVGIGFFF